MKRVVFGLRLVRSACALRAESAWRVCVRACVRACDVWVACDEKFSEEQFRREFQIRKLYTPTPHQLRVIKEITCGEKKAPNNARAAKIKNMHKSTSIQNMLRWTTINEKSPELNMSQRSHRSNKYNEDALVKSINSNAFADLVG